MSQVTAQTPIIGYGPQAYAERVDGYSPDYVRDSVIELFGAEIRGDILDAGSGDGGWIKYLQSTGNINRVISVDFVDDGASQIPEIEFQLADLSFDRLPCGDAELDWMFAVEVLEHLANPRNFIDRKSTRLNSSHLDLSRMPSSA